MVIFLMTVAVLILPGCTDNMSRQPAAGNDRWYTYNEHSLPRWSSPENRNGLKGKGGMAGNGAKGSASFPMDAGSSSDLLNIDGQGIIDRIWITVSDRSPEMLRSLRLEMYWDHSGKPAVSVPLSDFFGVGLGRTAKFYNVFFADPEGRSFNCFIPMPFKKGARIRIVNESNRRLGNIFFDVDYQLTDNWDEYSLYFHAYWHRDTATTLGKDFELLPFIHGKGRFLGVNIGINANPLYKDLWWGEGEVKMYLDGDRDFPTLAGTGTEDYIGTAWGQGEFYTPYTGCTVGDTGRLQWACYRYHIPDPVFFQSDCRVTLQQMGGGPQEKIWALQQQHVPLVIAQVYGHRTAAGARPDPGGWTNFYRSDDVSATAYFYLDSPSDPLPPLQPVQVRIANLTGRH